MRIRPFISFGQILLLSSLLFVPAETSRGGTAPELSLREVRSYEVEDFDHPSLRSVKFPPDSELFAPLEMRSTTLSRGSRSFLVIFPERQPRKLGPKVLLAEPVNVAFDSANARLFLFEATTHELVELWLAAESATEMTRLPASELDLNDPRGVAIDWGGKDLFVLDRAGGQIVHLDLRPDPEGSGPVHLGEHRVSTIPLETQGLPELGGLAHDPVSRHFLILSSPLQVVYEFSDSGRFVKSHDLSEHDLVGPVRLLVAPSADLTDDPSVLHLYLADSGPEGELLESRIREFSLSAPPRLPEAAAAMETASLVQVIDTSRFHPPSPDPAGIAYFSSMNTLLMSDSEVNEMSIYAGVNVWELSLGGSPRDTATTDPPSNEPTGVGFDPGVNASGGVGTVFFSDDTGSEGVYVVDLGLDGRFGPGDDIWTSFSGEAFGSGDSEGITFDQAAEVLFLVDGVNAEVYRIEPGPNGVFDGVKSDGGDDQVSHWDTARLGVDDPEGIAFSTSTGTLYVVGKPENLVIEVTTSGSLVSEIDISAANADKPAGLAVAPRSNNPAAWSLYITDRAVDNNSDPRENDGKIYEMTLTSVSCSVDADCDDGLWCNGAETCPAGICQAGADPCPGQECDEATQMCLPCNSNGVCESGEDCNTCSEDCIGAAEGCGNGFCEPSLGEDCLSCSQDCNGKQNGRPDRQFCCGDGGGTNPVGCADSRCNSTGFACSASPVGGYCCGNMSCEAAEDPFSCALDCGDAPECGDSVCDPGEDECSCPADCGSPSGIEDCTDGRDNDCDGLVDGADPDCCSLGQSGDACTVDADCCSNRCRGKRGAKVCKG
jgi:DNA-binding beta-propeller fold protein YncE